MPSSTGRAWHGARGVERSMTPASGSSDAAPTVPPCPRHLDERRRTDHVDVDIEFGIASIMTGFAAVSSSAADFFDAASKAKKSWMISSKRVFSHSWPGRGRGVVETQNFASLPRSGNTFLWFRWCVAQTFVSLPA